MYFFNDTKIYNIDVYNQILDLFTQFTVMYESCNIDYTLIDSLYRNMVYIRTKILYNFNAFTFNIYSINESKNLIKTKQSAKKVLNDMLDELVLLYKKKIYYNGYNNLTTNINISNILPHNILFNTNPVNRNNTPVMSDLLVW
jgi:hypothetical protein